MKPVRTALVGCGKVGGLHAAALASLPESMLVAVCDPTLERAEAFAARYGGRVFREMPRMVRESGAEAVFICTPHPLHAESAVLAAQAGMHVMVEKPMAANLADCDAMLRAAEKSGVTLSVMSQRRFYEPVLRMKAAIDAGKIGRPVLGLFLMFSWRDRAYYESDPWRGKWATEGGGVLVNQSPHQLDLLRWFMGDVEEISGRWSNLNHHYIEVDDTAVATLKFRNGGLGSIVTSLSQKPGLFTKVHIHGSNGASIGVETDRGATFIAGVSKIAEPPLNDLWTIPGEEQLLPEYQAADRARFQAIDPIAHYHALQIQDFLRAIREDRPPLVTGEDGRAVVEIFSAIYESNKTKMNVPLTLRLD
ncbi:MAG: Gfo/Idh/MocA family oxidoreductase [Pedosphaera sp.]|nr:Gfo/Idh/MocA family oxidoreductase [Pedosphaera sp.]